MKHHMLTRGERAARVMQSLAELKTSIAEASAAADAERARIEAEDRAATVDGSAFNARLERSTEAAVGLVIARRRGAR